MALVYKSICNEADTQLLQLIKLVEKEIRYKVEIEKLMHKGFVNIAKARYIMGSTCVTKMQLPSEKSNPIQPVATVCRAELNNHWVFHIHRKDKYSSSRDLSTDNNEMSNETMMKNTSENLNSIETENDNINCTNEKNNSNRSEAAFKNLLQNDPKALKKSKYAFHVDDELYNEYNEELLDEISTDSESNESLASVTDPIRLFGVLVPSTLKQAQVIFKDVVNLIGKCATLQSELREVIHRYNHLMRIKGLIEAAAKEIKMEIKQPKVYWTPSETTTITSHTLTEETEEEEEEDKEVSVQKSIRSVFYDLKDEEVGEGELSAWGSDNPESGNEN